MVIEIKSNQLVDYNKIIIPDVENENFWKHHGHSQKDKSNFREEAKKLVEINKKIKKGAFKSLNDIEKKIYKKFYSDKEPIKIIYLPKSDNYFVEDGRHRIAICKEEKIKLELPISYYINFEIPEIKDNEHILNKIRKLFFHERENKAFDYTYIAIKKDESIKKILNKWKNNIIYSADPNYIILIYEKKIFTEFLNCIKKEEIDDKLLISKDKIKGEENCL